MTVWQALSIVVPLGAACYSLGAVSTFLMLGTAPSSTAPKNEPGRAGA